MTMEDLKRKVTVILKHFDEILPVLVSSQPQFLVEVLGEQVLDVGTAQFGAGGDDAVLLTHVFLGVDATGHNRRSALDDLGRNVLHYIC